MGFEPVFQLVCNSLVTRELFFYQVEDRSNKPGSYFFINLKSVQYNGELFFHLVDDCFCNTGK